MGSSKKFLVKEIFYTVQGEGFHIGRPMCRLHGLRMLDPKIFSELPLSSADSTNAGVNAGSVARFGMYPPPTSGQRAEVIASRIESHNSSAVWARSDQVEMFA